MTNKRINLVGILDKLFNKFCPLPKEEKNLEENVIIDTGEDILSISPSCMERNETEKATNCYIHVGNHKVLGCWGILLFYNLDRYKALYCSRCGLRIKVPIEIKTAEELKKFLENKKENLNKKEK